MKSLRITSCTALLTALVGLVGPTVVSAAPSAGTPTPAGFWLAASDGGVFAYGTQFYGSAGAVPLVQPVVGIAEVPRTQTGTSSSCCLGYWLVASDGGIFTYGSAQFYGSLGNRTLSDKIVAMAATPSGNGYWLLGRDGTVYPFGDADHAPSTHDAVPGPYVAIASTPSGNGYWLITDPGAVIPVGDARHFTVSGGAISNGKAIVGVAVHGLGTGLWIAGSDGSTVSLGDAPVLAPAAKKTSAPVVGIGSDLGDGYWLALANGVVQNYGDAPPIGPQKPQALNKPAVGISTIFR